MAWDTQVDKTIGSNNLKQTGMQEETDILEL